MADDEQPKTEPLWLRILGWLDRSPTDPRETLLAVSKKWLPFCAGLIVVLTFGWTWIIYGHVVEAGEHHGIRQVTIAVVNETAKAAALIVLYAVSITYTLDIVGGIIVVTARYLTEKFIVPMRERMKAEARAEGLAEGLAEGRAEGIAEGVTEGVAEANRKWENWNQNRIEAEKKGVPFDEPPPSSHSERPTNGREANP